MASKKERVVILTDKEINTLIDGCWCAISDFCVGDEDKPYRALIAKLEGVMNNGSGKIL